MKPVNSIELINRLEAQAGLHLAEAIKVYQHLTNEELNKQGPDGGWSIVQCQEHATSVPFVAI
jgi:hypothetical protein